MFNYIFNLIKVKAALRNSLRNLRIHGHQINVIPVSKVTGVVGKKLEDREGYAVECGKYILEIVLDCDTVSELVLMSMLEMAGLRVQRVMFSFYKGVGNCYDGKPDGWVRSAI